ncbi:MAG: ATP-binding protein [Pseudomonadota bacterium]
MTTTASPPLTALSDQAPVALIGLSSEDTIRDTNQSAEDLFGVSRRRLIGQPLSELVVNVKDVLALTGHARKNRTDTAAPEVRLKPKGIVDEIMATVRVRWFHSGELVLAVSPTMAREAPDPVVGVASFGRILGHEIKNPLAGISGAAQLLLRQAHPTQRELLSLIYEEAGRIERLINRLSAFELFSKPHLEEMNIHETLDRVIALEEAAFDGQLSFVRRYDPSLPDIEGDKDHLHEAFQNIVRNGIEAALANVSARTAKIEIRTAFESRFARRNAKGKRGLHRALRVDVSDSGSGPPNGNAKALFEAFTSSKSAGRGLGLTVVKEVLTAHAGQVTLRTTDEGTKVSVFLPIGVGG